ncbi:hypothetical protein BGZ98_003169 [Dissophora globulifera]|nr:hypothetical protein BGZ98_003169 [Dissophora globulifera]
MSSILSRWFHASAIINATLYFSGGISGQNLNQTTFLDEVLALDLSRSWTIDNPAFKSPPPRLTIPVSGHTMNVVPGTSQLVVAGGETVANLTSSPLLLFDTASINASSAHWSPIALSTNTTTNATAPTTNATAPTTTPPPFHQLYHTSLTTGKDGILLHGGYRSTVANGSTIPSLFTLNPRYHLAPLSTAAVSTALNSPSLARHTMTLMPDGRAIILGGIDSQGVLSNLSMAYIMDTQANSTAWKIVQLSGKPPDPRVAFSTVMVNSTTLLVYGGTNDYKQAFWVTFYLDLPTMTWSSPNAQGNIPKRWGHTATMAGSVMVVAFGLTSHQVSDNTLIVLLDTVTNTWITQYDPKVMSSTAGSPNDPSSKGGGLSLGGVLGVAFLITAILVGAAFWLLIRRKKRRTRNTMARENLDQFTTSRAAIGRQQELSEQPPVSRFFGKVAEVMSLGVLTRASRESNDRPNSRRYSEFSQRSHSMPVADRIAELGYIPSTLGYPEAVVQQGMGMLPASSYIYPNQATTMLESTVLHNRAGQEGWRVKVETQVVFHDLTVAQKDALRIMQEQERHLQNQMYPKTELLQQDDDE